MALRELVTGSDGCAPGDGAGPSNAFAGLANNLLGTSSKEQERLREIPGFQHLPGTSEARYQAQRPEDAAQALAEGPSAMPGMFSAPFDNVDEFLHGAGLSTQSMGPGQDWHNEFQDFQQAYRFPQASAPLVEQFHAFLKGGNLFEGGPPADMPALSVEEKCKIRDRSTIMARQIFQEGNGLHADAQVDRLLKHLRIDPMQLPQGPAPQANWDQLYMQGRSHGRAPLNYDATAQNHLMPASQNVDRWADQFADLNIANNGDSMARDFLSNAFQQSTEGNKWAQEFGEHPGERWADEFSTLQTAANLQSRGQPASQQDAMEQTRALAETMAVSNDPKFKNSKFLQFVSKMSRGEIILEDNQAKEVGPQGATSSAWAQEFEGQQNHADTWAEQFREQSFEDAWQEQNASGWADEFRSEHHPAEAWADQFASNHQNWAPQEDSKDYVFAANNPFMQDLESFQKGKELFRNGLLSEARLAFEAEVQRNPGNVDAWRLLGTVHAENDNDLQAIAALHKALAADPHNAEVLLSLGVSYTNELDQQHALEYLMAWLGTVPGQQGAASVQLPKNGRERLRAVIDIFKSATQMNAGLADAHVALGVLFNLSRDFDNAVGAFRTALQTRTTDYSLWNKLGATLANSARSGEAIEAYQKALDLKNNYMRAWVNMGIAQANLAEYESSARFYVRALGMNPQAFGVWGYLRNVLVCAGRTDLMEAVEDENLVALQNALPL